MSLFNRICIALFGICVGIVVLFSIDMLFNSGRFAAHAVHAKTPQCSDSCHGATTRQDIAAAARILALPTVRATDRPTATQGGPWRDDMLGMRMENEGGH